MFFSKKKLPILIFTGIIILAVYLAWSHFIPVKFTKFYSDKIEVNNNNIDTISNRQLIPLGKTVGVKLYCDGVLVVKFSDINTIDGIKNPSRVAGLRENDLIKSINGKKINTTEDLVKVMEDNNGHPLEISIERNQVEKTVSVTPQISISDNKSRLGIYVRDSAAGIGTLTYYDPLTNEFGGLGHGICDIDTNQIMKIGSGSVTDVSITDVKKGYRGEPGEIRGIFVETQSAKIGSLSANNQTGIYGKLINKQIYKDIPAMPVAKSDEVQTGKAYILADVTGNGVEKFEINIEKTYNFSIKETKNMLIKITDQRLLELTGGIVQGMSGSPIIQNDKIIGAVTHVLVNDPTRGYGIFIENMLKNAPSMQTENSYSTTFELAA